MFLNYLKVAMRNLFKHKSFSIINILGLAIGMPICLLIILVVSGQRTIDQFHTNKDRIFRVVTRVTYKTTGSVQDLATAPAPLSPLLKSDIPEVQDAVRLFGSYSAVKYGQKLLNVEGFFAEPSFFRIFSFGLRTGNPEAALRDPFSAVLSADLAQKIFGDEDPMGRVLTFPYGDVRVTGVLEELEAGQRSHLSREILISFSTLEASHGGSPSIADSNSWDDHSNYYQYLLLTDPEEAPLVEGAIPPMLSSVIHDDAPYRYQCSLQPLTGIALGPELVNQVGHIMEGTALYLFLAIAFVVMVPVIFNYVSLTIARSLRRSKEIGIRKVVGAQRGHVVMQILFESVLTAMLSLIPAVVLLDVLLPAFNDFQFVDYIAAGWKYDWRVYAFFVFFAIAAGSLAGVIPAVILSSVSPSSAVKGLSRVRGFSGLTLRKVFLVIQFGLSLFFITLTILFHRQVTYMLSADYGFDKEHVISVRLQQVPFDLFRNEVARQAGVIGVSASSLPIGRVNTDPSLPIQSGNIREPIKAVNFFVSENHIENLEFTLLAGRNFSRKFGTDSSVALVVNKTAARRLGFDDPSLAVDQVVTVGEGKTMKIIGVTEDFHYARLQNTIEPVVLQYSPQHFAYALVKTAPGEMMTVLAEIKDVWSTLSVDLRPLQYQFLNEFILGAYNDMRDIVVFFTIIAGLAIGIACLGLLGMAIFSTETRVKEIGIRKVFGASEVGVVALLSRDLVKLFLIAIVFVTPLLWAFVKFVFSERVAFRVSLGLDIFLPGVLLVMMLAFLTVGSQTIKAANGNPVDALRHE